MIVAEQLKRPFYVLSAVSSGVKDVREVIQKAESQRFFNTLIRYFLSMKSTGFPRHSKILYWPQSKREPLPWSELRPKIHSFEVILPLLSRCQIYVLKSQEKADLEGLIDRAVTTIFIWKKRISLSRKRKPWFPLVAGMPASCWISWNWWWMPSQDRKFSSITIRCVKNCRKIRWCKIKTANSITILFLLWSSRSGKWSECGFVLYGPDAGRGRRILSSSPGVLRFPHLKISD